MDHTKLTRDQAKLLQTKVAPTEQYLRAVLKRMDQLQFPREDSLRVLVTRTVEGLRDLRTLLDSPNRPKSGTSDVYPIDAPNPL
jgi:hypothetical protein